MEGRKQARKEASDLFHNGKTEGNGRKEGRKVKGGGTEGQTDGRKQGRKQASKQEIQVVRRKRTEGR
jgi:hypothetical protein